MHTERMIRWPDADTTDRLAHYVPILFYRLQKDSLGPTNSLIHSHGRERLSARPGSDDP